jgi:transposase
MARRRAASPADPKVAALRAAGALYRHADAVRDDAFVQHPFFDARDRLQVKYEMLRRHRVDERPVTEVAASFSVSRQAFYEALNAYTTAGLPGLLPKRPGPKRAHKCTEALLEFAERWQAEHGASADRLAAAVVQEFHVTIHPRSLTRALERRKKKRPAPEPPR